MIAEDSVAVLLTPDLQELTLPVCFLPAGSAVVGATVLVSVSAPAAPSPLLVGLFALQQHLLSSYTDPAPRRATSAADENAATCENEQVTPSDADGIDDTHVLDVVPAAVAGTEDDPVVA